jgi:hypothetical protein
MLGVMRSPHGHKGTWKTHVSKLTRVLLTLTFLIEWINFLRHSLHPGIQTYTDIHTQHNSADGQTREAQS